MKKQLIENVKNAGIVGAGGAGFPSHVKYDASVHTVIANGAECEPLLYCDQYIMSRYAKELVAGIKYVMQGTGATRGVIALKEKYHTAVDALLPIIKQENNIILHMLGNFYPAGDEQVIVHEVTGDVVPEGGIPLNVGVVVANVSSLVNVSKSFSGENVTSRCLTVNGAVNSPFTAELPIGLTFAQLLNLAKGASVPDFTLISGGPMMGKIATLDDVVTKTTSAVLVLPSEHPHILRMTQNGNAILKRTKSSCDQCMACTEICPRFLMGHNLKPHKIMRSIAYGISDTETTTSSFLCCDCGVCSFYACPLFLSPSKVNSYIKTALSAKGVKNPHRNKPENARIFRTERLLPIPRLVSRIGLDSYAKQSAPFMDVEATSFATVKIMLRQHIGSPAVPVVKMGQSVKNGQLIADIPEAKLGAKIHASIDGTVADITDNFIVIQRQG